jgi:hypothetical protein
MSRFSARQVTVMVVAICVAVTAAPIAAVAATGAFSSGSSISPAVSAKNTSSGSGAKGIDGYASALSGTVYGVYGRTNSRNGFGVYSAGRLGTSGALVCSHCVTGGDVNVATLPTVPDASGLGGHKPAYYARFVPLSSTLPGDDQQYALATVDGLQVVGACASGGGFVTIKLRTDSVADDGTLSLTQVQGTSAATDEFDISPTTFVAPSASNTSTLQGTAIYRNNATGRIVRFDYHLNGQACGVFGDLIAAG